MKLTPLNFVLCATFIMFLLKIFGLFAGPWSFVFAPILLLIALVTIVFVFMFVGANLIILFGGEIKISNKIYGSNRKK